MTKIKFFLRENFFRDRLILVSLAVALLTNIILWIWLSIKFGYSHERTPLHFSVITGIDHIGSAAHIYELPLLGFLIILFNLTLARLVYEREKLLSYFLAISSATVQFIFFAAISALVNLVF